MVGTGRAATLHAEAIRAAPAVELAGFSNRSGADAELARALDAPVMPLDRLIDCTDALVIAVPPVAVPGLVATVGDRVAAILVESPVATRPGSAAALAGPTPVMTGANLVHSPPVRRGLHALAGLDRPHHIDLRAAGPAPTWGKHGTSAFGGGALLDPGSRLFPVLLAAAARPIVWVEAEMNTDPSATEPGIDSGATVRLGLDDARVVTATIVWRTGPVSAELEAADAARVVTIDLLPRPAASTDGAPVAHHEDADPLTALGFVDQIRRLARVAQGTAEPWPGIEVGAGVLTVTAAAAMSAADGRRVRCDEVLPHRSPAEILADQ